MAPDDSESQGEFACPACDETFETAEEFRDHTRRDDCSADEDSIASDFDVRGSSVANHEEEVNEG